MIIYSIYSSRISTAKNKKNTSTDDQYQYGRSEIPACPYSSQKAFYQNLVRCPNNGD